MPPLSNPDPGYQPQADTERPDHSGSPPDDSGRDLADVLANALQSASPDAEQNSEGDVDLRKRLQHVARQSVESDVNMESALVSMVQVVVDRIEPLTLQQKSTVAKCVANTLFDDPEIQSRLQKLWRELCQAVVAEEDEST